MSDRVPPRALAGRAQGIMVGSLIAFCWAVYGLSGFDIALRYGSIGVAAALTAVLLVAGVAMYRRARSSARANPPHVAGRSRAWLWFSLNFIGEVVLLNIASTLLAAPDLRDFWVPAISAAVGLHFWPMAYFFRARSYWWIGAAMMCGGALTAFLVAHDRASAFAFVHADAVANAIILWCAMGASVVASRRE